MSYFDTKDS